MLAVSLGSHAAPAVTSGGHGASALRRAVTPTEPESLATTVERARRGDGEAFGRLYDHYQSAVFRIIYGQVRSTTATEDLTSETFFKALRGIEDFKLDAGLFEAWLFRIARNVVVDHFRASRTRLERSQDMASYDVTLDRLVDGAEVEVIAVLTRDQLLAALADLTDLQRRCLELRFLHDQSITRTAALLGTTEGAVKSLQLRGLRSLAERLGD